MRIWDSRPTQKRRKYALLTNCGTVGQNSPIYTRFRKSIYKSTAVRIRHCEDYILIFSIRKMRENVPQSHSISKST